MNGSWRRWKEWCEFEKPEEKALPLEWKSLGAFEKLLVIRCLRPDRLTMAISNYVRDRIGSKYVDGFTGDLKLSYVAAVVVLLLGLWMLYYAVKLYQEMDEKAAKRLAFTEIPKVLNGLRSKLV